MTQTTKPPKQAVRDWFDRRIREEDPPPSPEEIRRQLGWTLIEAERMTKPERDERN